MFLILFGSIFAVVGAFFAVVFIMVSVSTGEVIPGFIGGGLGILFFLVGSGTIISGFKMINKGKRVIRDGVKTEGIIVECRTGSGVVVNGNPPIDIVVLCSYMGAVRQMVVNTGEYNSSRFPVGAAVTISILGVEAAYVKGSVRFIQPDQIPEEIAKEIAGYNTFNSYGNSFGNSIGNASGDELVIDHFGDSNY